MKRASKLVAVLAAAVLITTGCSSSSSDNAGADVKVGLAYDIGGRGDKSFNDSAALGLDEAKAKSLNIPIYSFPYIKSYCPKH